MRWMKRLMAVKQVLGDINEVCLTQLYKERNSVSWYASIWADTTLFNAYGSTRAGAVLGLVKAMWLRAPARPVTRPPR